MGFDSICESRTLFVCFPGCAASRVIKKITKISTAAYVHGVTSVDDELFVLLGRDDNQVAVYSINDYQLLRHLHVPGLKRHYSNHMTSCVRHKCLYMSDVCDKCIHRYDLASSAISKWLLPYKPYGLSLTSSNNLLVTCRKPNKLVELSADSGQWVREIALQSDIVKPFHGAELTTFEFVVCHGAGRHDSVHQVCVVGDDGKVTRSYGGQRGSDVGQLNCPYHLAVDKDSDSQSIFVAEWGNDRVALLSPTLEFVRYVREGLSRPYRLYFHHATGRLFVGHEGVTVIPQYSSEPTVPTTTSIPTTIILPTTSISLPTPIPTTPFSIVSVPTTAVVYSTATYDRSVTTERHS